MVACAVPTIVLTITPCIHHIMLVHVTTLQSRGTYYTVNFKFTLDWQSKVALYIIHKYVL